MPLLRQDICPFCTAYENMRLQTRDETKFTTTFWVALRVKKFRWKESTSGKPLMALTINESRLHYCPRCGKQLIALRHRASKNGVIE